MAEGKQIQAKVYNKETWYDTNNPDWTLPISDYRIKPERKTITGFVNVYHNGLNCVVYNTKEEAKYGHIGSRIACVPITITYEEGLKS